MYSVFTDNKSNIEKIVNNSTGEVYKPKYLGYTNPDDYIENNVIGVEPMTAKEYLNSEELEHMLTSPDFIAEEKLDGTRCTMHLNEDGARLFSRRISKKTEWYAENSDSVPHLRDLEIPTKYIGTILDGEMRIDGRDFKDVSSTLNCKYDEAILRQTQLGFITFHAFDIVYYKGIYVAKLPLKRRKELLSLVVRNINFKYLQEEPYTYDTMWKRVTPTILEYLREDREEFSNKYPELYGTLCYAFSPEDILNGAKQMLALNKKAWYEYIILHNGEGLMLKDSQGTYRHKRGREYTKLKRFDTYDVVVLDYMPPTREYTGKEIDTWQYWAIIDKANYEDIIVGDKPETHHIVEPVTKHYAHNWIGTIKYGVVITDEELEKWRKSNPKEKPEIIDNYLVVGEASGFDEETREYITNHKEELRYTTIEVGANEVLKTGKLRHPRFIRLRPDKESDRCVWKDHIRR